MAYSTTIGPSAISREKLKVEMARDIGETFYDPLEFVLYVFPWGEVGGPLEQWDAPDEWQIEVLKTIRDELPTTETALKIAISAGHGVGKSALMSWIIMWWLVTRSSTKIVCTAGTKTQLATKLWPELGLWVQRSLISDWYEWQATSLRLKMPSKKKMSSARADAIPWSDRNPDAFAGTHGTELVSKTNTAAALYIFDEASTIADTIWETSEGAMTDAGAMWLAFGNPVRSSGRFFECFGKFKNSWRGFQVDARKARMPNKAQIEEWRNDYGEESDFFKVRVKGVFPNIGSMQLIPTEDVERAMRRSVSDAVDTSRALGADIARFGDDASVICKRTNNRVLPDPDFEDPKDRRRERMLEFRSLDLMTLADKIAEHIDEYKPDTTFVDGVGVGSGVVDRLRQLSYRVIDVNGGTRANEPEKYRNKRTEMYVTLRDWLRGDVSLPNDPELKEELIGLEYGFINEKTMQIERKDDFKKRLGRSPDRADAIALTFAARVRPQRHEAKRESTKPPVSDWRVV